jgi:hypothetical protein
MMSKIPSPVEGACTRPDPTPTAGQAPTVRASALCSVRRLRTVLRGVLAGRQAAGEGRTVAQAVRHHGTCAECVPREADRPGGPSPRPPPDSAPPRRGRHFARAQGRVIAPPMTHPALELPIRGWVCLSPAPEPQAPAGTVFGQMLHYPCPQGVGFRPGLVVDTSLDADGAPTPDSQPPDVKAESPARVGDLSPAARAIPPPLEASPMGGRATSGTAPLSPRSRNAPGGEPVPG